MREIIDAREIDTARATPHVRRHVRVTCTDLLSSAPHRPASREIRPNLALQRAPSRRDIDRRRSAAAAQYQRIFQLQHRSGNKEISRRVTHHPLLEATIKNYGAIMCYSPSGNPPRLGYRFTGLTTTRADSPPREDADPLASRARASASTRPSTNFCASRAFSHELDKTVERRVTRARAR